MAEARRLTLLGATGSIGTSTLDLVRAMDDKFKVDVLTAGRDTHRLIALAREFEPRHVAIADETGYEELKAALADTSIAVHAGAKAIADLASMPVDITISAITGMAGLAPTLAAVRRGGVVAIANKEAIVTAGTFILDAAAVSGARILPVDSEHNAIYQAWQGQLAEAGGHDQKDHDLKDRVSKITLTASGGPFWGWSRQDLASVTPQDALKHPNWSMGDKITIDSATLMNKGLEVIEAVNLFGLPEDRIDVLVHRQSAIHGMVHYRDGSCLAQLGAADMRIPISHVLDWPNRLSWDAPTLDLAAISDLTFVMPDNATFPCLELARAASREGGLSPTGLNAANEKAVDFFLSGAIGFLDIDRLNAHMLESHQHGAAASLEAIYDHDAMIRADCDRWLAQR